LEVEVLYTLRQNVRSQLRVIVKRTRRTCGYPPDMPETTRQLVLEQAEVLSGEWALTWT
jgi:type I restriction enzyme R subunit